MTALWLRQLAAVFRLEIRKSFFARRGLWIYLLALAPVLIIGGHAWETHSRRQRWLEHGDPAVTLQKIQSIRPGMTKEEVLEILPNPRPHKIAARRSRADSGLREGLVYEGRQAAAHVQLLDGKVVAVNVRTGCDFPEDIKIFAGIFQFFYVRLAIFFGCVFVFLNLFRGEMLDKSLHYYFLAPVRREIVVWGKYLAGLVATVVVFAGSAALQLWIYYRHFDGPVLEEYLAQGHGWQHAAAYVGVAALACLGYGSVFLAAGILIRNPLIPAAGMLFWEALNGLLPLALRRLSIIYYLKSLCPVEIPLGGDVPPPLALLALNVEAAPPAIAVLGLVAMAAALLILAAWRARTLEIHYAAD